MGDKCETCRAPVAREGDRVQFDSSRYHMDAAKKLSEISALKGALEDASVENKRLTLEMLNISNGNIAHHQEHDRLTAEIRRDHNRINELKTAMGNAVCLIEDDLLDRAIDLLTDALAGASDKQERPGLGFYDDGMVKLGYRSGSSSAANKQQEVSAEEIHATKFPPDPLASEPTANRQAPDNTNLIGPGCHEIPVVPDDMTKLAAAVDEQPPLSADAIIQRLCSLQEEVSNHIGYDDPADCFCGKGGFWDTDKYDGTFKGGYRNEGKALEFIEKSVREAISAARQQEQK